MNDDDQGGSGGLAISASGSDDASEAAGQMVERLFRHESGRLLATITRRLGPAQLEQAEDIVQHTLVTALETWRLKGVPAKPAAWLMRTALNRLTDTHRRQTTQRRLAVSAQAEAGRWHGQQQPLPDEGTVFDDHEVRDDVLRMMFSCCHPTLPAAAQLALMLKVLGGFGVPEIASALLVTEAAVEKRLSRAKHHLRSTNTLFQLNMGRSDDRAKAAIVERRSSVMRAVYLLFNEGYHCTGRDHATREDLCAEALRLGMLLADHPTLSTPGVSALVALMAFHAARLSTRVTAEGNFVLLEDQDRTRWEPALIALGCRYLNRSATGEVVTTYHLEAAIAFEHCRAPSFQATDWAAIVQSYEDLAALDPSPVIAINRAVALAYARGWQEGLAALSEVERHRQLTHYPFLHAARAAMLAGAGYVEQAHQAYGQAYALARTDPERRFYRSRQQKLVKAG